MAKPTREEMRAFVAQIGGEDAVCERLGASLRTLQSHYDSRGFPAAWWLVLSRMGASVGANVPDRFFRWKSETMR